MPTQSDPFLEAGFAGRPIDHCLVVDAHGHLGENPRFPIIDTTVETQIAAMDRMGIDIFYASAIPGLFSQQARRANDLMLEAMRRYPGRIYGYMVADVAYEARIVPELERCLAAGMRAIKIHSGFDMYRYDNPSYAPLFEFAEAHSLPLLAHTWGQEIGWLEPLFSKCPNASFLLAHSGVTERENYARVAREYPNVYLETCFSGSPRGLIEYFFAQGLADKMIWGSDAIFMGAEQQIGRALFARISPEEKRKFLGANAARVLKLPIGA